MMAGHGFMQRERHHFPDQPRLRLVEVDVEIPWPPAVDRTGVVISRGRVRSQIVRNRHHPVWGARQHTKDARQLRIDALGQRAVGHEQLRAVVVMKFRVVAQESKECRHVALEADLGPDRFHVGVQTRHFLQADLVDLRRAEIGSGVDAGEVVVIGLAIGQVARSNRLAAGRQVLFVEESLESPQRGQYYLSHRRLPVGAQSVLLGCRDAYRHRLEWRVVTAVLRSGHDLRGNLRAHPRHDSPGRQPAAGHALLHQRDGLVGVLTIGPEPCDPVEVILAALEPQDLQHAVGKRVHAALLGHRYLLVMKAKAGDLLIQLTQIDSVVELVSRAKCLARNGQQGSPRGAYRSLPRGQRCRAQIRQPVVVAIIAQSAGSERIFAQLPLVVGIEQGVQGSRGPGLGRRVRGRGRG